MMTWLTIEHACLQGKHCQLGDIQIVPTRKYREMSVPPLAVRIMKFEPLRFFKFKCFFMFKFKFSIYVWHWPDYLVVR